MTEVRGTPSKGIAPTESRTGAQREKNVIQRSNGYDGSIFALGLNSSEQSSSIPP